MSVVFEINKTLENQVTFTELEQLCETEMFTAETSHTMSDKAKQELEFKNDYYYYLGEVNKSGRGVEFAIIDNKYSIRVLTPTAISDYELAFKIMSALAKRENSKINCEDGNEYDHQTIFEYDFITTIEFGLKVCMENDDSDYLTQMGINYAICLDKDRAAQFLKAENPAQAYSEYFVNCQWLDYYPANQAIYHSKTKKGYYVSIYNLSTNLPTILPSKPILEMDFLLGGIKDEMMEKYLIHFFDFEKKESIGEMDYAEFISKLSEDKYYYVDAINIAVSKLSRAEIEAILKSSKPPKKRGILSKLFS